jgi:hypothetical protein
MITRIGFESPDIGLFGIHVAHSLERSSKNWGSLA